MKCSRGGMEIPVRLLRTDEVSMMVEYRAGELSER